MKKLQIKELELLLIVLEEERQRVDDKINEVMRALSIARDNYRTNELLHKAELNLYPQPELNDHTYRTYDGLTLESETNVESRHINIKKKQ